MSYYLVTSSYGKLSPRTVVIDIELEDWMCKNGNEVILYVKPLTYEAYCKLIKSGFNDKSNQQLFKDGF